jgi:hypothetical protein
MPNPKLKLKIFLLAIIFCSIFGLTNSASAIERSYYFSQAGLDTNTGLTEGSPFKTLNKMNDIIAAKVDEDIYTILLRKGDTWTFTGNTSGDNPLIIINKSNVTLDSYGTSPDKPIITGNGLFPAGFNDNTPPTADVPYNYAITIGSGGSNVENVYIKNIKFYNLYEGGAIIFKGPVTSNFFIGPGSVEYCEFDDIGWSAIQIYGVRAENSAQAIKVEHNVINNTSTFARANTETQGWPQAITSNGNANKGHECRYNIVSNNYSEGIGATGFDIIEYNMAWGNHAPNIYCGFNSVTGYTDTDRTRVVRYNLTWMDSDTDPTRSVGIRVDDEDGRGDNSTVDIEIYGNIFIGGEYGIDLRNNPIRFTESVSSYEGLKVYNNTVIDAKNNFVFNYPQRLGTVDIRNNVSILNEDVDDGTGTTYGHYAVWASDGLRLSLFSVGPNFWYGDGWTENALIPNTEFRNVDNVFGTQYNAPILKDAGWRNLTSLDSFEFSDLYPVEGAEITDSPNAEVITDYDRYLTTGTNWETLPSEEDFILIDQDEQGSAWDFGAIIRQQLTGQSPYGNGTQEWPIPGEIVLANYDQGGEAVAYHDTTSGNAGTLYRTDDVDIWHGLEGYYVGAFATGEWLEFSVDVAESLTYEFSIRSATTLSSRSIHIEQDGTDVSGAIAIPNTGSYSAFETVLATIPLTAGPHILRVYADAGGFNLSKITIIAEGTDLPPGDPTGLVVE